MSQTWELEVRPTELQVGDVTVSYQWGSKNDWTNATWIISKIGPAPGECWHINQHGEELRLDDGGGFVKLWRINRPKKTGRVRSSNPKDWPHSCPRCGRANSAIVLFSTVECKEGCYA